MNDAVIERLNGALEGRYRIDRELGEGGMATVFLADDLRHDLMIQALQASGTESEARLVVVEGFDQVIRETGQ